MAYKNITRMKITFLQNQNTNISMLLYVPDDCSMNLTESSTRKRGCCQNRIYIYGIQCVCVLDRAVSGAGLTKVMCKVSLFVEKSFLLNSTENSRS